MFFSFSVSANDLPCPVSLQAQLSSDNLVLRVLRPLGEHIEAGEPLFFADGQQVTQVQWDAESVTQLDSLESFLELGARQQTERAREALNPKTHEPIEVRYREANPLFGQLIAVRSLVPLPAYEPGEFLAQGEFELVTLQPLARWTVDDLKQSLRGYFEVITERDLCASMSETQRFLPLDPSREEFTDQVVEEIKSKYSHRSRIHETPAEHPAVDPSDYWLLKRFVFYENLRGYRYKVAYTHRRTGRSVEIDSFTRETEVIYKLFTRNLGDWKISSFYLSAHNPAHFMYAYSYFPSQKGWTPGRTDFLAPQREGEFLNKETLRLTNARAYFLEDGIEGMREAFSPDAAVTLIACYSNQYWIPFLRAVLGDQARLKGHTDEAVWIPGVFYSLNVDFDKTDRSDLGEQRSVNNSGNPANDSGEAFIPYLPKKAIPSTTPRSLPPVQVPEFPRFGFKFET